MVSSGEASLLIESGAEFAGTSCLIRSVHALKAEIVIYCGL